MDGKYKYIRIEELRERKDYTQKHVALELNIEQRTYSHYERGTRQIPLQTLCQLADLYGVSVDYILERTDIETPYPKESR